MTDYREPTQISDAGPGRADTPPAATDKGKGKAADKEGTDWWGEIKGLFWLILAVLAFHSFIAKPFYIPSESMMPGLVKGDRLVVSKYPYGWSWVSPSFHIMPETPGRLFGRLPERGDIVIVTPPGARADYIKRVIGLPGDRVEMIDGQVFINGVAVPRQILPPVRFPVDPNLPCTDAFGETRVMGDDGQLYCELPLVRETLPNGRAYDTIDMGHSNVDDVAPLIVPEGHVWLLGDNRDRSADSRVAIAEQGLGGPVPWQNIGGRAEFITFSLDGTSQYWNPISWFTAMRGGRAGTSLHPERVQAQPAAE
ncbi:MAG: signal peptidase I [Allosphingosinicella sp.]|uniref:signal peptidase I n=1 Tax=Allosphingosinicella sp. TaxID=2823234 RepID=UPI00394321CF